MSTRFYMTRKRTSLSDSQGDQNLYAEVSSSREIVMVNDGRIGATSGWTVTGGTADFSEIATCTASQTGATLVVPITGLWIGDTITAFSVNGQIESGGGAVTLDAQISKITITAAANVIATIGSGITQISAGADATFESSEDGLSQTVAIGEVYFILLTATTAGSTDIVLSSCTVTVKTPS